MKGYKPPKGNRNLDGLSVLCERTLKVGFVPTNSTEDLPSA